MRIDTEIERFNTPGCKSVIHLNNAGASLMSRDTIEKMHEYINLEAAIGGYEAAESEKEELLDVYNRLGKLVGATPQSCALFDNGSRAWSSIIYSFQWQAGDEIIFASSEYGSNVATLNHIAEIYGVSLKLIPTDDLGLIDVEKIQKEINKRTKLIAVTHIPMYSGIVNPIIEIGRLASRNGIYYVVDACQSIGQKEIDVSEIQCSVLVGTSRKFLRGPRGVAFAYVDQALCRRLTPSVMSLHASSWEPDLSFRPYETARKFESWEASYSSRLAFGAAINHSINIGMEAIEGSIRDLVGYLKSGLEDIEGIIVQEKTDPECGIITFHSELISSKEIKRQCRLLGINMSTVSRDFVRLLPWREGVNSICRISPHYFNTQREVDKLLEILREIHGKTR